MRDHKGMRPQDIVILLAILSFQRRNRGNLGNKFIFPLQNKYLADSLKISGGEISSSIVRSSYAGLIDDSPFKTIFVQSLFDFLRYGLRYVFPTKPGALVRGVPTAHSTEPLRSKFSFQEEIVWEHPEGSVRGQAILPLYATVPEIINNDPILYELLALTDSIRIGGARERELATAELEKRLFL